MTLLEVITLFERIARRQPSVNSVVDNDVFKLNAIPDAKYGVFAWTQGQHSGSMDNDFLTFSFTFFYVDRLTRSADNTIEIQSVGVQTIDNILLSLSEAGVGVDRYTLQPFTQRFTDECAGVYANVNLSVPRNGTCTWFNVGDFNDDYNKDYNNGRY